MSQDKIKLHRLHLRSFYFKSFSTIKPANFTSLNVFLSFSCIFSAWQPVVYAGERNIGGRRQNNFQNGNFTTQSPSRTLDDVIFRSIPGKLCHDIILYRGYVPYKKNSLENEGSQNV